MALSFRREYPLVIAGMRGRRAEATMRRPTQISRDEQDISCLRNGHFQRFFSRFQ
jgi:hypothetical protein